jgi:hypothetical protein
MIVSISTLRFGSVSFRRITILYEYEIKVRCRLNALAISLCGSLYADPSAMQSCLGHTTRE